MGQTTLVIIVIGSLVGFAILVVLILSVTLTPERAQALGTVFSSLTRLVRGIRGEKDEDGEKKDRKREEGRVEMERGFASGALAAIAAIIPKGQNVVSNAEHTQTGEMVVRNKESAKGTKNDNTVTPATEDTVTRDTLKSISTSPATAFNI